MRKLGLLMLALVLALALSACGGGTAPSASLSPSAVQTANGNEEDDQPKEVVQIGFSIAGEGAFFDQLETDIEAACAAKGYSFSLMRPKTAQEQANDIAELLGSGISVLVIGPADVDGLETALAECESDGVPVINIIDSINGKVSTLVSPDYTQAGAYAAERADSLFGEAGVQCLELKSDYDSFVMQLLSDGFAGKLAENSKLTLVSEQYCSDDEEQAYLATKTELQSGDNSIGFIFAQSSPLARGALRAIQETGSAAKLAAFTGDMDLISAVASGVMDAAIFIGSEQLAGIAVDNAGQYLSNPSFAPEPFIQLELDVATADNATEYYSGELLHAQVRAH